MSVCSNFFSLCSPCSEKYHATNDFKLLKPGHKVLALAITLLVAAVTLPLFVFLATLTFRCLVEKFLRIKAEYMKGNEHSKLQNLSGVENLGLRTTQQPQDTLAESQLPNLDSKNTEFYQAVSSRVLNGDKILSLIEDGVNIYMPDAQGMLPLHHVAVGKRLDILKTLTTITIRDRRSIDVKDLNGRTPLSYAAETNDKEMVEHLLQKGSNPNIKDENGMLPLNHAIQSQSNIEILKVLTRTLENVNDLGEDQSKLMSVAIENEDKEWVDLLLQKGADPALKNETGETPLHLANEKNNLSIVKLLVPVLIRDRKSIDIQNNDNKSPLWIAVEDDRELIALYLLKKDVDLSITNAQGFTLLHLAAKNNNYEIAKLLLQKGIDSSIQDDSGNTALHYAVKENNFEMVELLACHIYYQGKNISIINSEQKSPLWIAIEMGFDDIAKVLIAYDYEPNTFNSAGYVPFHFAAYKNKIEIIEAFIEEEIKADIQDRKGQTPVHIAAPKGFSEIVRKLCENYDNNLINMQTFDSKRTALSLASEKGQLETVNCLLEFDADINIGDNYNSLPIHWAAEMGHLEVVKSLLNKDRRQLNVRGKVMRTPLFSAVVLNQKDVVRYLRDQGADLGIPQIHNGQEVSALQYARTHGYNEMVQILEGN